MNDLYNEFLKGRLGNSSLLSSRTTEIHLVYQKDEIVYKFHPRFGMMLTSKCGHSTEGMMMLK